MVESGSVRKYVLYALGELILVVLGILIALQINNWNEARKARIFELQLLEELKNEMADDIGRISWAMSGNANNQQSASIILDHLEQAQPMHDSLYRHFAMANAWWQLPMSRSAFQNIEDYGMHFIRNEELRKRINTIYGSQSGLVEDLIDRQSTYFYSTVVPLLTDMFDSSSFGGFGSPYEMIPLDYDALRESKRYLNILRSNIKNRGREIDRMNGLKNNMEDVVVLLQMEIEDRGS